MIYKLLRYAIAILFGSMGYVGADALSTLMKYLYGMKRCCKWVYLESLQ